MDDEDLKHKERLESLGQKLDQIQSQKDQNEKKVSAKLKENNDMGMGLRAGAELVVPIVVGVFLGYQLDQYLSTLPLFLILFFFFGVGAGFMNIFRLTAAMDRKDAEKTKKISEKDT